MGYVVFYHAIDNREKLADVEQWSAAFLEFGTTWILLQRNGKVQKEDLRQLYDVGHML